MNRVRAVLLFIAWTIVVGPAHVAHAASAVATASPVADGGYAHPDWLVDPAWLEEHAADPTVRIIALTPADVFAAGHIPGAAQIDWPDLEVIDTADPSIARWQGDVETKLTGLGIAPTDTVVI
jgi:3-mercaptopyruvate sulfurtransferase SseA